MKKWMLAIALALALTALSDQKAKAVGFQELFSSFGCHSCSYGQFAPWYLYWPMEAHFQTPAPVPYPYYSGPMTPVLPYGGGGAGGYSSMPYYWYPR